ncbi:hypothetical protein PPYR_05766 [Photinus pyralis]|uniref:Serpin domain-containing protein n=1 Tax=Photinus pyralis TaxID=7054 RepID=A0A1Y1KYZ6_PHOPY|nr:serine protease inhibitor 77Ba-like [Photinus pyralis]KAB0801412.1 hypothetical protein PPYR_05766 [Photinus pyralis]
MVYLTFLLGTCVLSTTLLNYAWAQGNELAAVRDVGASLNQFTLRLLAETNDQVGDGLNLALSPYTVWSLLTVIAEGANGNTAKELEQSLGIPPNKEPFRRNYKSFSKYLQQKSKDVQLDLSSAIFTTKEQNINRPFQTLANNFYGVDIIPTNFKKLTEGVTTINNYVSQATNNRINNFVKIEDVADAEILLVSTLFFKGRWRTPFNKTATFRDTFYDSTGNKVKGSVQMMYQLGDFPYTILSALRSHAIELPFGDNGKMSLVVILPQKGEMLNSVLRRLSNMPFSYVFDALEVAEQQFAGDLVHVFLPRFNMKSELNLNQILDHMGIRDVLNPQKADLLGIFPHYLFVSRVIHEAKIEVNEEGAEASAAAGAALQNKIPSPKFQANRDFAYFIIDKPTRSILFAGKFTNPTTICDTCT